LAPLPLVVCVGPGAVVCGLAEATDELGSIGGEVCTVVGLGLVVVGSTLVPLSWQAASATATSAAGTSRYVSCFTCTDEFSRGLRR
jgi:hypothetical protein